MHVYTHMYAYITNMTIFTSYSLIPIELVCTRTCCCYMSCFPTNFKINCKLQVLLTFHVFFLFIDL